MLNTCKVRRNTRTREIDQVVIDRPFTDERANVIYNYYRSIGIPIHLGKEAMRKELEKRGFNVDLEVAALHGSPHSFVRFLLEKIGTGEGAQRFGWGLYFTELEDIARQYANKLATPSETLRRLKAILWDKKEIVDLITIEQSSIKGLLEFKKAIFGTTEVEIKGNSFLTIEERKYLEKESNNEKLSTEDRSQLQKYLYIDNIIADFYNALDSTRNLYRVTLHKGKTPDQYTWLEWDNPVPKTILDKIANGFETLFGENISIGEPKTGEEVYDAIIDVMSRNRSRLESKYGADVWGRADKLASLFLLENGIDGIKYPAESIARGATSDTARGFNYVVFDENAITIEEHIQFLSTPSGEVYGFVTPEGEMFLDPDVAGVNTLIHEGAHIQYKVLKTAAERGDFKAQAILDKIQELTAPAVDTIFNAKKAQERSSDSMSSVDMQTYEEVIRNNPNLDVINIVQEEGIKLSRWGNWNYFKNDPSNTDEESTIRDSVEDIDISKIISTETVSELRLEQKGEYIKPKYDEYSTGYPIAIRVKGSILLLDGHHRLELAKRAGESTIKVAIKDLQLGSDSMFSVGVQTYEEVIRNIPNLTEEQVKATAELLQTITENAAQRAGVTVEEYLKNRRSIYTEKPLSNERAVQLMNVEFSNHSNEQYNVLNQPNQNLKGLAKHPQIVKLGLDININEEAWIARYVTKTEEGKRLLGSLGRNATAEQLRTALEEQFKTYGDKIKGGNEFYITEISDEYVDAQIEKARAESNSENIYMWEDVKRDKQRYIDEQQTLQRQNLSSLYDYYNNAIEYPLAMKLMILDAITKHDYRYNKDKDKIGRSKRGNNTISPHILPNSLFMNKVIEHPLSDKNIIHDYFYEAINFKGEKINLQDYKENVHKVEDNGTWYHFTQNRPQDEELFYKMSALSAEYPGAWCTGASIDTARNYLENGDLYIFYDNRINNPSIQLHVQNSMAIEIGGLEAGQGIRPEDVEIIDKFKKDNPEINLSDIEDYNRYSRLLLRWQKSDKDVQALSREDSKFLLQAKPYYKDSTGNLEKFKESLTKKDYAYIHNITEEDVFDTLTNDNISKIKENSVILGITHFNDLELPEGFTIPKGVTFNEHVSFHEATLPKGFTIQEGVTFNEYVNFSKATLPEGFTIPKEVTFNNHVFFDEITLPERFTIQEGVTFNGHVSFYKAVLPQNFTIPKGVTFNRKVNFFEATLPERFTIQEGVTFNGEVDFSEATLPQGFTIQEGVTFNGDVTFNRATLPQGFTIPEGVTFNGYVDFSGATLSEGFTIQEGVTFNGYVFFAGVTLPERFTIQEGVTFNEEVDFSRATLSEGFTIQEGVTFNGNVRLTRATLPQNFTIQEGVTFNGEVDFSEANLPEGFTIQEGVTFNEYVFFTGVTLPEGFTIQEGVTFNEDVDFSLVTLPEGLYISQDDNSFTITYPDGNSVTHRKNQKVGEVLQQDNRGVIVQRGETSLTIFNRNSDITTIIHEKAHEYEHTLTPEEVKVLEEWSGHKQGTVEFSEAFAKGAEKVLYDGTFANKQVENIFTKFARWFQEVIQQAIEYFSDINEMNPEVLSIYRNMMTRSGVVEETQVQEATPSEEAALPKELLNIINSSAYNQRENETDEQYRERLIEEVYATALGSNGEQYLKDLGFTAQEAKTFLQKVQEFLAEIVDWLRGKKGLQDLSVDEINRLSIREFLDRSTTSMMLGEFKDPSRTAALTPNREVQVYITPATVRNFNEETLRLKELTNEYNKVAKEISQGNLENQERFTILQNEILDTYQEHIQDKVSKIRGVNVSFNQPYLGSWEGIYEPSLNMTLSISPNADTGAISGLLFDIAENTSQDAFILEERSEIEGRIPLTEFDEAGMSHYPQIRVIFDKQLTVEEKSIVAQRLISKGIDDFSIDGDYFIASILDFKSKTNKQKEEFYDKKHAAITTLFTGEGEKIGTNKVKDIQEHIRKSRYVDARNAGDKQSQTREYDRSDLFEAQSPNINPQISGEQELQQPQIAVQRAIQRNNGHPLHLAPNGKPSILYQSYRDLGYTEQQAKELTAQVYSDNFLNWFGDWINDPQNSSKVVDSNGQPMLMYHGSPSIDIEVFDRSKSKASSSGLKEFGDFFTSNRRLANLYRTKELSKEAIEERNFQIRKYTELLHSARNNKDFDIYNNILNSLKEGRVYTTFLNIRTPLEGDAKGMDYDAWSYMKLDIGYKTARGRGDVLEAISGNNTAYDSPFDGALIHNMADMLSWGKDVSEYIGTVAMTLRPNQIKSATDNVGTFSSESNNINFQISGEIGASDNRSSQTQGFFSDVVTGASDRFKPNKPYQVEVQYTPKQQAFEEVYSKHRGNFDEHIATSIPRFRETQVQKGTAISAVISQIPDAKVLDIGGSEGSFVKSITEVSGAQSINLEPNPDMAESHRSTPVTGSEVVQEAFYEGFGDVQAYRPTDKFDVVHESMVFQFITSDRVNFVKEVVNNYLKEGGLFITEEKLKTGEQTYIENEIQKDTQHKSKYYDESQLKTKSEEILGGMNENQASAYEYLSLLRENFDYVGIYWNSGNFYGIVATNSKEKFNHFMQEVGDTTSEYTKHPIGEVTDEVIERIRQEEAEQPLTTDIQGVQVLEYQGSTLSYKQRVNPITNQPTNQIEIDLISVPQENRNQGHARELLRRMTEIADSRGQELYLFAAPRDRTTTTEGLIKLYREFGFESISSFLPEEMVRPARRDSQRAEESLPPAETLLTVDLDGVQEYVPADKIITYYSEMGEINYKENSEGELVMLKTISATPQQEESITYKQLLSIPNLSKEQALEAYKNLYSTDYYDWKNKTNEC